MKLLSQLITLLLLHLVLVGCGKNHEETGTCVSYTTVHITKINTPATVAPNQQANVLVSYYLVNGCGSYDGQEVSKTGNTYTIKIKAKYDGCACTAVLLSGESIYPFQAPTPGKYYLRFLQQGQGDIVDSIIVQ